MERRERPKYGGLWVKAQRCGNPASCSKLRKHDLLRQGGHNLSLKKGLTAGKEPELLLREGIKTGISALIPLFLRLKFAACGLKIFKRNLSLLVRADATDPPV
jgi:hypothetical protein